MNSLFNDNPRRHLSLIKIKHYHIRRIKKVHWGRGQLFSYWYINMLLPSQSYTVCTVSSHWSNQLFCTASGHSWIQMVLSCCQLTSLGPPSQDIRLLMQILPTVRLTLLFITDVGCWNELIYFYFCPKIDFFFSLDLFCIAQIHETAIKASTT